MMLLVPEKVPVKFNASALAFIGFAKAVTFTGGGEAKLGIVAIILFSFVVIKFLM
ncbi:hypothetical protein REG_0862 [Candidatus Regiella insecticola LSR1]|uniref:Uncharacterized protein n=2 Tax=Candidatus Regiella insecticola TaxID=138073 RepID=E0WSC4_9ENTR|nr:hypothetical protein REG_0862 [Candidatus Regiella insecticola LSR1]